MLTLNGGEVLVNEHKRNKMINLKQCSRCKKTKSLYQFHKNKSKKDGYNHYCKECVKEYKKKNKKYYLDYAKQYKKNNKEKITIYNRKYKKINKEKIKKQNKQYRLNNQEKCRELRISYKETKNKKRKEHRHNDKLFRFQERISNSLRKQFNNLGLKKTLPSLEFMGITLEEFNNHLVQFLNKPCVDCGNIIINEYNSEIDHIIPLWICLYESEVRALNQLDNLRLVCKKCNGEKHKMFTDEWFPILEKRRTGNKIK